jgi:indolepyruvate decarboxylase
MIVARKTIGSLVLDRLHRLGVRHIFGIPGDYVLGFYKLIENSPITHIGTTREDSAGFAADAYARINGVGALCVTYCVGGLNTVNPVACAYAERSPVVMITGSPGLSERARNPYLHHMVRDFSTQRKVFENVTVAAVTLDDAYTAEREIDQAFAALLRYRRPIYLEIPRDMVNAPVETPFKPTSAEDESSDPGALAEAIGEVRAILASAKRPVLLAGAEIGRFGLQDDLIKIVEGLKIPIASTLLGKSIIHEGHPLYVGVYSGLVARDEVKQFVHEADCLLILGSILSDVEDLDPKSQLGVGAHTIHATADRITVKHRRYDSIRFEDFVRAMAKETWRAFPSRTLPVQEPLVADAPSPESKIMLHNMFQHLNGVLTEKTLVIADVGEALFASVDLRVHRRFEFLAPAYYTSMGFAVPAAVGASFADPSARPIVLVGDGAFQMTGSELATAVRHGQAPVVIILNNRGYSTEREILEGPFNDLHEWRYEKICDLIGGGIGTRVTTFGQFTRALSRALTERDQLHVMNVILDQNDRSPAMVRIAKRMAKRVAGS